MAKKARLSELNRQLRAVPDKAKPKPAAESSLRPDPNPERGERGDFLSVTIRLPADMLASLQALGIERRQQGKPNRTVSALIREAVAGLLAGGTDRHCPKCKKQTVDVLQGNLSTGKETTVCAVCGTAK